VAETLGFGPRSAGFFAGTIRLGDVAYFCAGTAGCLILAHAALLAKRING
jgi:hypothetical protein